MKRQRNKSDEKAASKPRPEKPTTVTRQKCSAPTPTAPMSTAVLAASVVAAAAESPATLAAAAVAAPAAAEAATVAPATVAPSAVAPSAVAPPAVAPSAVWRRPPYDAVAPPAAAEAAAAEAVQAAAVAAAADADDREAAAARAAVTSGEVDALCHDEGPDGWLYDSILTFGLLDIIKTHGAHQSQRFTLLSPGEIHFLFHNLNEQMADLAPECDLVLMLDAPINNIWVFMIQVRKKSHTPCFQRPPLQRAPYPFTSPPPPPHLPKLPPFPRPPFLQKQTTWPPQHALEPPHMAAPSRWELLRALRLLRWDARHALPSCCQVCAKSFNPGRSAEAEPISASCRSLRRSAPHQQQQ